APGGPMPALQRPGCLNPPPRIVSLIGGESPRQDCPWAFDGCSNATTRPSYGSCTGGWATATRPRSWRRRRSPACSTSDSAGRPAAGLYAVAANLARDAARGEAVRARRLRLLAGELADATAPSPEQALLREETSQGVRAALLSLSERDRLLLLLREEGLTYRE